MELPGCCRIELVRLHFDACVSVSYRRLLTSGDSLAFLNFQHGGSLIASVKREVKKSIRVTKNARIYLIYRDPDTKKIKGTFLFGGRKAPPWAGYGSRGGKVMDVDES